MSKKSKKLKVEVLPPEEVVVKPKNTLTKQEIEANRLERDMKIIALCNEDAHTLEKIAEFTDCSVSTVTNVKRKYASIIGFLANNELFKANKIELYEGAQLELLKSALASDKLEASTTQQLISSAEKLNSMKRLEQNKSTSNTAIASKKFTE